MSNQNPRAFADYVPVELRRRHDGWTPARQVDFLVALSESACVEEACGVVGMSSTSAYALRRRIEAESFRAAWDAALDYSVVRLGDAAVSRSLKGVARPIFYKGEQVGERRYYDERLTMFILRTRDPARFGKWREQGVFEQGEDAPARRADALIDLTEQEAERDQQLRRSFGPDDFDDACDEGSATAEESGTEPDSEGDVS